MASNLNDSIAPNTSEGLGSEYNSVLSKELNENLIREFCLRGGLRTSSLRSIIWRVLLRCLPITKTEWITVTSRNRVNYEARKKVHLADPHDDALAQDPNQFNPLSQTEQNPWQKYFADNEIRDLIAKDVDRTCPEIQFFQDESIRSIMRDVLLVYAKEHPCTSYKQGMHEILAPLLFVLYSDQQAYYHAKESIEIGDDDLSTLDCIYNQDFLEHDGYTMFCEVMLELCKWYEDRDRVSGTRNSPGHEGISRQEHSQSNQLLRDLNAIEDQLHALDPMLARHLAGFEISPQLYGIRWLRLLFGREFPMHDLLYLWDVILSDRPFSSTVECIAIALLESIRDLLLSSDLGGCLQYLMRVPPIVDITSFIQHVCHYRSPKRFPKPTPLGVSNYSGITVAGSSHPNLQTRGDVVGFEEPPSAFRPKSRSVLDKVKETILDRPGGSASGPVSPRRVQRNTSSPSKVPAGVYDWEKSLQLMENQVHCLQTQLNDRDVVCADVARLMDMCATDLLNATTEEARKAVASKINLLSKRLIGNGVRRGMPAEPIELALELGASRNTNLRSSFVKVKKENEMVEFKNPRNP